VKSHKCVAILRVENAHTGFGMEDVVSTCAGMSGDDEASDGIMQPSFEKHPDVRRIINLSEPVYNMYCIELTDDQPRIFNHKTGFDMKPWITNQHTGGKDEGTYRMVGLQIAPGKTKHFSVGDIVLRHFVGPPPTTMHTVEHKDKNKLNNALWNLEWLNKSDQIKNQDKRTKVGEQGCGRAVTAVHESSREVRNFANPSCALKWLRAHDYRVAKNDNSAVVYILALAKNHEKNMRARRIVCSNRGYKHDWSYTYSEEHKRVDALEWRPVPSTFVGGNTTVACSSEGHVRWNGGTPKMGGKRNAYLKVNITTSGGGNNPRVYVKFNIRLCGEGDKAMPYVRVKFIIPSKAYEVHRLVSAAWHGLPPKGKVADHSDGDTHNNRPDNLEWVSKAENRHRYLLKDTTIQHIDLSRRSVLHTFPNYMCAVNATGVRDGIGAAVYGFKKNVTAGGWLWRKEDQDPIKSSTATVK
jgi:HNH endonuclease